MPKLPFTGAERPGTLDAQAEYIFCMENGHKFAAHGDRWHYQIDDHILSLFFPRAGQPRVVYRAKIRPDSYWLDQVAEIDEAD